jgi:hypothetical protein
MAYSFGNPMARSNPQQSQMLRGPLGFGAQSAIGEAASGAAGGMGFGPWGALIGGGLGLLGALQAPNRFQTAGRMYDMLQRIGGPQAIAGDTQALYNMYARSPMASLANRQIVGSTNSLQQGLQRSLGARGLASSGIGATAVPMAQSAGGYQMAQLQSQLWQMAQQAALQSALQRIGIAGQIGMQPGMQEGLLGALIGAAGPALGSWLGRSRGK